VIHGGDRGTGKWRKPPANCYSLGLPKNAPPAGSTVTDPCCPTAADALDAAVNGCPERAPRGLRNRAGVPQIP